MTDVATVLEAIHERFRASDLYFGHGTDNAWDDAVRLVLDSLTLEDRQESLSVALSASASERLFTLAEKRVAERIPVPYLTGWAWFCGRRFKVAPGVIVPRSPIGELIGRAFEPWLRKPPERILDLCCGSGCLGIAAALAFPAASVTCVDIAEDALALCRANSSLHGVSERVRVVKADLFDGISPQRFDLILCNPPYVSPRDLANMPVEYRHEPQLALAGGGDDGLELMAKILQALPPWLTDEGLFVGEVGVGTQAFSARFPRLPVVWVTLEHGGEGVFVLEAAHPST